MAVSLSFYLPLMIPSLSNARSGSHRNTINVCLVLPNGVRGRRHFWQLVEWGSEEFTHILMWVISVLSFRNNINLYMRLHWNTWVPFSPAEGGEPPKCQTQPLADASPLSHTRRQRQVWGGKTSPARSKRLRLHRPRWKEETMPVFAAACFLPEHLPLLK